MRKPLPEPASEQLCFVHVVAVLGAMVTPLTLKVCKVIALNP